MKEELYLLAGTYTKGESKGIYVYRFDAETGNTVFASMIETENPSYLTVSTDKKYVYSVSENEEDPSYANAFSFNDEKGELKFLNRQVTQGASPCYISVNKDNSHIVTANYGGGSISIFELNDDGRLLNEAQLIEFAGEGVDEERQDAPHLHSVVFSPDERFLFATDLGTDKIYRFAVNNTGEGDFINDASMMLFKVEDRSGPRHLIFHPSGKFLYLINELSGTIIGFKYEDGDIIEFQTERIDDEFPNGGGDIAISPDGRFLYASKRERNDGVVIFSIDTSTGELARSGYEFTGIHPRNINISPDGKFLLVANKDSNLIEIYERNDHTGLLQKTSKSINLEMPVYIEFL